jgi:chaperone required for assembly of F1-ATPase
MPEGPNGAGKSAGKPKPSLPKRFYKDASAHAAERGFSLKLDGKTVRTPGKAELIVPTRALAEAIAAEWRAQGERIDPETIPLTKLANAVIDGVAGREQAVIDDVLAHAGADLVCYRATAPEGLVQSQRAHWDPVLAWAREDLGAPLEMASGISHVKQPQTSLDRLRERVASFDAWQLAALHVLTGLSGSALIALAVALGRLTPEEGWQAAHVDEDWQISQWGEDDEARARRARGRRDVVAARRMLSLLT